ncbi:probable cytochrome P450 12a5, mitochondrial [Prorops nasuta]|uniref:probable cytochrome P450 12a5, mitochondrial n=1 Tax=Prorops nasuta TaxID=863751 RepID=UPI0034CDA79F
MHRLAFHAGNRFLRAPCLSLEQTTWQHPLGKLLLTAEKNEKSPNFKKVSTIAQTQTKEAATSTIHSAESIIKQAATEVQTEATEVAGIKLTPSATIDKSPLPFEEIPGPAVLRIWEKYWKYVPVLGTQLFCSLLINRFTEGQLVWNRNVTPIKYFFNEYGPIVRIHGPIMGDVVMIHRGKHIEEVLKNETTTPARSGIDVLQHYRLNYKKYRLAGPFSMQNAEWLQTKKKLTKPMEEIVNESYGKVNLICDEFINRIRKIRNRQDEVPSNFNEELLRWGMDCFCTITINRRLGFFDVIGFNSASEPARIIAAMNTAHTFLGLCETGFQVWRFMETPFTRRLFASCDVIDGVIGKYIRQIHNKYQNTTLQMYEKSHDTAEEEEASLLEKLLVDEHMEVDDVATIMMDMIVLGVQAVTNCQAFLLYFLAKNPRAQQKLYEEINKVSPNKYATINAGDIKNMKYLQACLKESLRLRPAFPYINRMLQKNITLHGFSIPKGTFVIMATQFSAMREENFEDPEKFRPERWLTDKKDSVATEDFNCLPFGYGLRSCLGKKMAEMEMALFTAKLIREFRIEYDYADISSKFIMLNIPNKALRFRFLDRD